MYCPVCKNVISDSTRYCHVCGADVELHNEGENNSSLNYKMSDNIKSYYADNSLTRNNSNIMSNISKLLIFAIVCITAIFIYNIYIYLKRYGGEYYEFNFSDIFFIFEYIKNVAVLSSLYIICSHFCTEIFGLIENEKAYLNRIIEKKHKDIVSKIDYYGNYVGQNVNKDI